MSVRAVEIEKAILKDWPHLDYTPHGIPIPSEDSINRASSANAKAGWLIFWAGEALVIAFTAYEYLSTKDISSCLILQFLILPPIIGYLISQKSKTYDSLYRRVVRDYYEPVLASLPESPSDAWLTGRDTGRDWHIIGQEPDAETSALHVVLRSCSNAEFSFRFKPVAVVPIRYGGIAQWGYCMYAAIPLQSERSGALVLFNKQPAEQEDPVLQALQQEFASDPGFLERPEWAFTPADPIRIGDIFNEATNLNSVQFAAGKATIRLTLKKSANQADISDAVKRLLRAVELLKKAGAV